MTKILKVNVHYPTPENKDEYDKRAARALAKILINKLPPEAIEELIKKLKETKDS